MTKSLKHHNMQIKKCQSFRNKIDPHIQLSDLRSDLKSTNINIEEQEDIFKSLNKSIKDKLGIQIKQTEVGMNKVSESHIDTINNC